MRRVQALTAQQLADLARPRARVRLLEDLQLVLRGEPPALGPLDQLGVRDPLPRGRAAARFASLAYGSLRDPGRGPRSVSSDIPASSVLALKVSDFSIVNVSRDVGREGGRQRYARRD